MFKELSYGCCMAGTSMLMTTNAKAVALKPQQSSRHWFGRKLLRSHSYLPDITCSGL